MPPHPQGITAPRSRSPHGDRGANALEFVGILVLAALIVGAVLFGIQPERVGQKVCEVTRTILGQPTASCTNAPPPPQKPDPKPEMCKVQENSEKYSGEVKIGFIKIGENSGFMVTQYSNGKVKMTATDGATIGLTGGAGPDVKAGPVKLGTQVDFGGGVKFEYGSSWTFDNMDQANAMKKQLDDYLFMQYQLTHPICSPMAPVCMPQPNIKHVDPPPVPSESIATIGTYLEGNGTFGAPKGPLGEDGKPLDKNKIKLPGLTLDAGIEGNATVRTNSNNERTITTDTKIKGGVGVKVPFQHLGGTEIGALGLLGSSTSYKYDANGNLLQIEFTSTLEGGVKGKAGTGSNGVNGKGQSTTATVTTTTLKLDPKSPDYQKQVDIINAWASQTAPDGTPMNIVTPDMLNPVRAVPGDDFQNLLYNNAQSSSVQYDNVTDGWQFAASIKLGVSFGIDLSSENKESKATEASYLGWPDSTGNRASLSFPECLPKP